MRLSKKHVARGQKGHCFPTFTLAMEFLLGGMCLCGDASWLVSFLFLFRKRRGSSLIETSAVGVSVKVVSSCVNMVRTKANYVPGAYRKAVASQAPRKVLGSSTFVTSSSSSSRKAENKYAGGNPVCVRPTPKRQKGIREFFRLSAKESKEESQVPEEAGSSGLGKAKRKACPLQPDHRDDENE